MNISIKQPKKLYLALFVIFLLSGCASLKPQPIEQNSTVVKTASPKPSTTEIKKPVPMSVKNVAAIQENTSPNVTAKKAEIVTEPQSYKVEIGDSLYSIAHKNKISIVCLAKANKITDPSRLAAGKTLIIPKPTDC